MFTGIVSDIGEVMSVAAQGDTLNRIKIACSYPRASIKDGASICCAGICLTVTAAGEEHGHTWFTVDAAAETLALTTAGEWRAGRHINLERALTFGDELGGHLVAGHVDGVGEVTAREELPGSARMTFRAPRELMKFIAQKGSIALDGVSLTVNEVAADTFSVVIIPHTLKATTFAALRPGDRVNLEVDTMARYAARLAELR